MTRSSISSLTGVLRWGEAAALRRLDVDVDQAVLRVSRSLSDVDGRLFFGPTQTYQERNVEIPLWTRDILALHCDLHVAVEPQALVFTAPEGGPLGYHNFLSRVWYPAVQRAGITLVGRQIGVLRHTCASVLIELGATPKHIMEHLGHSTIAVTMDIYGHLFDRAVSRLWERQEQNRSNSGIISMRPGHPETREGRSKLVPLIEHLSNSDWVETLYELFRYQGERPAPQNESV